MSKQWKLISASAALSLLMAAFFFIFVGFLGVVDSTLYTAMRVCRAFVLPLACFL
jgi:hypothetical protein